LLHPAYKDEVTIPSYVEIRIGYHAVFRCLLTKIFYWELQDHKLPRNVHFLYLKSILYIKSVQMNNSGYYICSGRHANGDIISSKVKLTVIGKYICHWKIKLVDFNGCMCE